MCGIICILCSNSSDTKDELQNIFETFRENIRNRGPDFIDAKRYYSENFRLLFAASVLWLQGPSLTKQPVEDDKHILIYNGDIFGGLPRKQVLEEGDSKLLFKLMQKTYKSSNLSQLQGPYAFVYFDNLNEKLYFGRDIYGRRSLLIGRQNGVIVLTSVAKRTTEYSFMELPSIGIFSLDLKTDEMVIYPWRYRNLNFISKLNELNSFLNKEILVKYESEPCDFFKFVEPSCDQLQIFKTITNIDSKKIFETLLAEPNWLDRVLVLKNLLENAVEKRISTQPKHCQDCIKTETICHHSLTGVLFSGGIDCAILALLADKFTDSSRPIDLINVAFDESNNYQTPDRKTGMHTLEELRHLSPEREWHFREINVPKEELNNERSKHIADLVYPLKTVMDDSLGCALWFASRAKETTSKSPSRVLLVGMGADELFGGYTRHRAAFKKKGWQALHDVLVEDWQNLPYRNLARDDRVVSDHGRQLRTPYLDENVVQFVCSLNSWEKTYPSEEVPHGIGDKILLRSLGYYLGLKKASCFKKRALQFGSRIANSKENAHDISTRL